LDLELSPERTIFFLAGVEQTRHCSAATRNQRLAALRSLALFIGQNSPEYLQWCGQVRVISFKRAPRSTITYLEKPEMDALLAAAQGPLPQQQRDHAILLFLYNTRARADEVAQVTIADLELAHVPKRDYSFVMVRGKGNKLRRCPLWAQTVIGTKTYAKPNSSFSALKIGFPNVARRRYSKFGEAHPKTCRTSTAAKIPLRMVLGRDWRSVAGQ
jgi:integrase/recombinase XerD